MRKLVGLLIVMFLVAATGPAPVFAQAVEGEQAGEEEHAAEEEHAEDAADGDDHAAEAEESHSGAAPAHAPAAAHTSATSNPGRAPSGGIALVLSGMIAFIALGAIVILKL